MNFGGSIVAANGDKATFDGSVRVSGSQVRGPITYQDHGPETQMRVEGLTVTASVCTATSATIFGTASINGSGSYAFRIEVTDSGSPGSSDTFRIRLSNGYDSGQQMLQGGDIRIRL